MGNDMRDTISIVASVITILAFVLSFVFGIGNSRQLISSLKRRWGQLRNSDATVQKKGLGSLIWETIQLPFVIIALFWPVNLGGILSLTIELIFKINKYDSTAELAFGYLKFLVWFNASAALGLLLISSLPSFEGAMFGGIAGLLLAMMIIVVAYWVYGYVLSDELLLVGLTFTCFFWACIVSVALAVKRKRLSK